MLRSGLLRAAPDAAEGKKDFVFDGLCAFPLTPILADRIDLKAVALLVSRAARAGVNSLGVLGSTGNYAYLSREERRAVLEASIDAADGVRTPVVVLLAMSSQQPWLAARTAVPSSQLCC